MKHIRYHACIYFQAPMFIMFYCPTHDTHCVEGKGKEITTNIIARYLYKITMLSNLAINIKR